VEPDASGRPVVFSSPAVFTKELWPLIDPPFRSKVMSYVASAYASSGYSKRATKQIAESTATATTAEFAELLLLIHLSEIVVRRQLQ
jgi:hypothetical protein